ncbi:MAG: exosortase A [Burkholderiales bacterium]|nr:exosortase A [Burkholderiales bacterium]
MSSTAPIPAQRPAGIPAHWRTALPPLLLLLLAVVGVFHGTAADMVGIWWRSDTFAHAFVVPPISLWLAWRLRAQLAPLRPAPMPWLLLPMVLLAAAWLLGELVAVNAVTQLAFTAMLVLCVPAVLGWPVTRTVLFPLGFLFFAVPIGEFMMPPLMQATADFTIAALRLSGVPVYREGLQFVIPSGKWSVVEACSGVRYLMASIMVGSLFAYLNYNSMRKRWIFAGVSVVVPIVANWVRAYMIVMLGHLSNNKIAAGADHLIYGWVFFGIVIGALFMIGARWADPLLEPPVVAPAVGPAVPLPPAPLWWMLVAIVAVCLLPRAVLERDARAQAQADPRLVLPADLGGRWQALSAPPVDWTPAFQHANATARGGYVAASGARVGVHLAYYRHQDDKRKLVSSISPVVRADDRTWNPVASGWRVVEGGTPAVEVREINVLETEGLSAAAERQRLRLWHLYWVDGKLTARDVVAKLYGARQRLVGHGDDAASIVLFASENQPGGAEAALREFVAAGLGGLQAQLEATSRQR